ncbi:M1 family metallopeptidase [Spongiimicrobium salis]|uniref:M1 family metallopeptidase n=1 Tax=Spongiimicrobium salis TaxID=1667022 RepID=UPI00374DF7F7
MKKILLLSSIILISACKENHSEDTFLDEGVPLEMAVYRAKQLSDVVYDVFFDIPAERSAPITAELKVKLQVHDLKKPLYLDFKEDTEGIQEVVVNDKKIPIDHRKEHLIISPKYLSLGNNIVEIDFIAGELSLNRNDDYLYTLLVPDRARTLFPCFDQPDIKAYFDLTIKAPMSWEVVSGGGLLHKEAKEGFTTHKFKQTDKMSTYLFSFAAGKFDRASHEENNFAMELFYRETNPDKIQRSTKEIFDLHQRSVAFLSDYTRQEFPFQKLDFATIPGFQYGGMEHTGAIQYRESSLFLDQTATQSREIGRAKLIAHEVSHMWFGNLVTMKWFNDVWMKEVFANLMADKIINPAFPEVNHDLQFITAHYPRAYGVDRTKGANAMRQNLDNLNNAGSLYGSIIYNKAPIMMRQLETLLGSENFRNGLAEYIKAYANGNAEWPDLIEILDSKTSIDLQKWSNVWVNAPGRPRIESTVLYDDNKRITSFKIAQNAEDGSDKIWPQVFEIALIYPDSIHTIPVELLDREIGLMNANGMPKPKAILYNSDGLGYGIFPTSEAVFSEIVHLEDEAARGYAYINLYENILNGTLSPEQGLTLLSTGLQVESNELILSRITAYTRSLFWKYLNADEREKQQGAIEMAVMERLLGKETPRIKKTLFQLFTAIAYSAKGMDTLYSLWKKELVLPDLNLSEDDYTNIAMQLAVYGHPENEAILEKEYSTIKNPDKQKRFEFLKPALSLDPVTRATFFESFRKAGQREKENWVLAAASYMHHPLRQGDAIKNLGLSLEILEEIQRTGDIFFPKSWLDNTIGLYTSKTAFRMRETFLEQHPDLNPQLRMKLLQATDDLDRAQRLIKKTDPDL